MKPPPKTVIVYDPTGRKGEEPHDVLLLVVDGQRFRQRMTGAKIIAARHNVEVDVAQGWVILCAEMKPEDVVQWDPTLQR